MNAISDSFNWAFVVFPGEPNGHWYLELIPRIAAVAGFELGTGTFVNTIPGDEVARLFSRFA
jgi:UDPglucose--hexose-1-phosphate uridylyltransferase